MNITLEWLLTETNSDFAFVDWFRGTYTDKLGLSYEACKSKEFAIIDVLEKLKTQRKEHYAFWLGMHTLPLEEVDNLVLEMAREVLPIFEKEFPDDKVLRETLDIAIECRNNPSKENREKLDEMISKSTKISEIALEDALEDVIDFEVANAAAAIAAAAETVRYLIDISTDPYWGNVAISNARNQATFSARWAETASWTGKKFFDKYIDKMLEILKREEKE